MRLLLDTHTLIWYTLNDPQLSTTAQALIINAANEVFVSPASYWEIAIKLSIGKYTLHVPFEDFIDLGLNRYGFRLLSIEPAHTARLATMPFPPKHKDPFDRLLIAQAIVENIPIVSADGAFDAYPVHRLW